MRISASSLFPIAHSHINEYTKIKVRKVNVSPAKYDLRALKYIQIGPSKLIVNLRQQTKQKSTTHSISQWTCFINVSIRFWRRRNKFRYNNNVRTGNYQFCFSDYIALNILSRWTHIECVLCIFLGWTRIQSWILMNFNIYLRLEIDRMKSPWHFHIRVSLHKQYDIAYVWMVAGVD